ncbi:tetratricopeptide repeat protein [Jiulongibacter sp. NS-SX5]|uniref:tetratricopeptide repeat protein n=1 Tax=Jiulongibacter sp. NS-SX5 TaxID=3463854 RepID=UPI00405A2A34
MRLFISVLTLSVVFSSCQYIQTTGDYIPEADLVANENRLINTRDYLLDGFQNGNLGAGELFKLAEVQLELNNPNDALEAIEEAIRLRNTDSRYYFLKSKVLSGLDREEEALMVAEEASAMELETPEFYSYIAELYINKQDSLKAEEYLKEALFLAPGWEEALIQDARLDLLNNRPYTAQNTLVKLYKEQSRDPQVYYLMSKSLLDQNAQLDSALHMTRVGLTIDPNNGDLMFSMGRIMTRLGKLDSAIHSYEKAVTLGTSEPANGEIGESYLRYQNLTKASEYFLKQIELTPEQKKFYFRAGYCLERLGRFKQAQELYTKAYTRFPEDTDLSTSKLRLDAIVERTTGNVQI